MKITIKIAGKNENIDIKGVKRLETGSQVDLLKGSRKNENSQDEEIYWLENLGGEPIEDTLFHSLVEALREFNKY